jgi:GNAT superfamily N-acetyltransferase
LSEPITVRALAREDLPTWTVLWDGYNAFYGREGPTALAAEVTQMTWARFFDAHEPMHALVAERAGKIVGLVHFLFHRSTSQLGPVCYLQDLYTLTEARGKGVGQALINAVYEHAASVGCKRVYWHTQETNAVARRLYDKVAKLSGFIVYAKTY